MNTQIEQLKKIINESNRIVFFTGAGVSVDSNIPDFRSQDGLYNLHYDIPPETMISHSYFMRHPEAFYRFYKEKMVYPEAIANLTHHWIADLERQNKSLGVITQNIDGLHQQAGSHHIVELHGSIYRNTCVQCHRHYGLEQVMQSDGIPYCVCGGIIKPDVVLYEEALHDRDLDTALDWISKADCLIICGTSLSVYPAASLVQYFNGKHLVVLNRDATPMDRQADLCINANLKDILTQLNQITA